MTDDCKQGYDLTESGDTIEFGVKTSLTTSSQFDRDATQDFSYRSGDDFGFDAGYDTGSSWDVLF